MLGRAVHTLCCKTLKASSSPHPPPAPPIYPHPHPQVFRPGTKVNPYTGGSMKDFSDFSGPVSAKALITSVTETLDASHLRHLNTSAQHQELLAQDPQLSKVLLFTDKPASTVLAKGLSWAYARRLLFAEVRPSSQDGQALAQQYGVDKYPKLVVVKVSLACAVLCCAVLGLMLCCAVYGLCCAVLCQSSCCAVCSEGSAFEDVPSTVMLSSLLAPSTPPSPSPVTSLSARLMGAMRHTVALRKPLCCCCTHSLPCDLSCKHSCDPTCFSHPTDQADGAHNICSGSLTAPQLLVHSLPCPLTRLILTHPPTVSATPLARLKEAMRRTVGP
jgi:hypothetical protein